MKAQAWITAIRSGKLDRQFGQLYGQEAVQSQAERYCGLLTRMAQFYTDDDVYIFSTPGRTELSGNHTDHNHGKVIAAGIHLDTITVVAKNPELNVTLVSEGFTMPFVVDLKLLDLQVKETGTTNSLIRGIAARLKQMNHSIGGMHGFITSNVPAGSGLSSSAAVEVLIATMFNHLYNAEGINPLELAQICQYAENKYFGKPCGLMDQTACAFGGIVAIDFENPQAVKVEQVNFPFHEHGHALVVVHCGDSHADLTHAYARIPIEMQNVAREMGKEYCRQIEFAEFLPRISDIREKTGDRAILRYLHFYQENSRVDKQIRFLKEGNPAAYLEQVKESGSSSWRFLQNCYAPDNPYNQGLTLALGLTEIFLNNRGACRVHGGGFAGTIQAYIPNELLKEYTGYMEAVFGKGAVIPLRIRPVGTMQIVPE